MRHVTATKKSCDSSAVSVAAVPVRSLRSRPAVADAPLTFASPAEPDAAPPADPESEPSDVDGQRRRFVHLTTIAVVAIGLLLTVVLGIAAVAARDNNEERLLRRIVVVMAATEHLTMTAPLTVVVTADTAAIRTPSAPRSMSSTSRGDSSTVQALAVLLEAVKTADSVRLHPSSNVVRRVIEATGLGVLFRIDE